MIKTPDGKINLLIKFIHPYDTFYREDRITFFTDQISYEEALHEIMKSKMSDKFQMLTSAQLVLDTNWTDEVFITIVAPYGFPMNNDNDSKLVTGVINFFTELVWNKMKKSSSKPSIEECYQKVLEGKSTPVNLVANIPWLFKKNGK